MDNDDRAAWRLYAAAALTGLFGDHRNSGELHVIAAQVGDAMLEEEKRRFPDSIWHYKPEDVKRLVKTIRTEFSPGRPVDELSIIQTFNRIVQALEPFDDVDGEKESK